MGYDLEWDRRVQAEVAEVYEEMGALAARTDRLMGDFSDRRGELAEHALDPDLTDQQVIELVIEDPAYCKALDLSRRWQRLNTSLERFHQAWARQLKQLPGATPDRQQVVNGTAEPTEAGELGESGRFWEAVDEAIARSNAAFEATLCLKCAGTGALYLDGQRVGCDWCEGSGKRPGGDARE